MIVRLLLGNISTCGLVQTGEDVLIGGVIVRGGYPERQLVQAIGPDLEHRRATGALQNPRFLCSIRGGTARVQRRLARTS